MAIRLSLPGWLMSLILGFAAYLRGRSDQAAADEAAAEAKSAAAEKTVEDAAREVGALTDDQVNEDLGPWRTH